MITRISGRIACTAGAAVSVFAGVARAQTNASWLAAASGNWSDPARWSTNPDFPNNNAGNTFNALIGAAGSPYIVTLDTAIRIESFALSSADAQLLIQNSNLTLNRDFTQTAGVVAGTGGGGRIITTGVTTLQSATFMGVSAFDANGNLDFIGSGDNELCDSNLGHNGHFGSWSGTGNIKLYGSSNLNLGATSVFTISNNQQVTWDSMGTRPTISNAGMIVKATGAGVTQLSQVSLNNTGTLDVRSGTFRTDGVSLPGGALDRGTWKVSGGAAIDLQGATITTNRAKVLIDGAASTFTAFNAVATNDAAGEITVSGGNTFATNGGFTNSGRLAVGAGSTFQVAGAFGNNVAGDLQGGDFNIAGTLKVDNATITRLSGRLTLNGTGRVQNASGGDALTTLSRVSTNGKLLLKGNAHFTSGGSFKVEGINSGELNVESGSEFEVPSGSSLDNYDAGMKKLSEGDFIVQGTLRFDNAGVERLDSKLTLDGATASVVDAANTPALTPLKMIESNGAFTLSGSAGFTANPNDTAGFIFTVAPTGKVNVNQGSQLDILGDLVNYSAGTFSDGEFNVDGTLRARNIADVTTVSNRLALNSATARITNFTNADVFETVNLITTGGDFTVGNGRDLRLTDPTQVENRGGFTVGPGAGADFSLVTVDHKFLQSAGRLTIRSGGVLSTGGDFCLTGGELLFDGGSLQPGGRFVMTGGTLGGNGVLGSSTIEGGVINPGIPPPPPIGEDFAGGRLLISGGLRLLNRAEVMIEIRGSEPGVFDGYDQLDIAGTLSLGEAGSGGDSVQNLLRIAFDPAYLPASGTVFVPLVFQNLEGDRWFRDVLFENVPSGMQVTDIYRDHGYAFMLTNVPCAGSLAPLAMAGMLAGRRRR